METPLTGLLVPISVDIMAPFESAGNGESNDNTYACWEMKLDGKHSKVVPK